MYLKTISLKGFKSFPDRTRLEFGPGTSVIVGPNGSGKSNVTDAVLWALGEQSPLAVRGQTMSDVIFGGAPGRQAATSAEVELVLDDTAGVLGLGPEVSILRRLDRGGEGEYRLSGARCRLTDILEVLSDTGLGKEMHSVISQGRVDAIVISKPKDRRMLIEEAAGLGKHRKRRRRAQLKLGHTQDNLDRALDVEREARSRLKPLKRQAEAAELHERIHRQTLEARWELARDALLAARAELARAEGAAAEARSGRDQLAQELGAIALRRRDAEEALASRSARREELARRSYTARASADRIGYRAEAVAETLRSLERRLAADRDALARLEADAAADQPDPQSTARIGALSAELAALERDREAELARQLTALEAERADAEASVTAAEAGLAAALEVRQVAERELETARAAARDAERTVDAARRDAARIGGELAGVNQFLRSHAGAPGGAAALSDGLQVGPGYELALAAALDGRLGAALAGDLGEAERLLEAAGRQGGRVLLLGEARFAAGEAGLAAHEAGFAAREAPTPPPGLPVDAVCLAAQIVGATSAANLARRLLADAWVVEQLPAADLPAGAATLVTRAGRVYAAAAGEVRQTARVGEERVLAERNRQEELLAASESAVAAETRARLRAEAEQARASERDSERERAVAEHRAAGHRRDEAVEQVRRLSAQVERRRRAPDEGEHAGRRAQLSAELRAERARIEQAERDRLARAARIEQLRRQIARDEALIPAVGQIAGDLGELGAAVESRRIEFDAALASDREAGELAATVLREAAQAEATQQAALQRASAELTTVEVARQRAADAAEGAERRAGELALELGLALEPAERALEEAERAALADRLGKLERRREQLGPVNPLAQHEYEDALAHVEELERQRTDLESALRELEKLIRDTDRQIRETFEATFSAAAEHFEQLVPRVFPGGSGRLVLVSDAEGPARVIGGMGPRADAPEPEGDGSGTDSGPDDEGPTAEEDRLGVEIEITPAGKAMKRLTLLSGGEKSMTALAFLFAVFLARPCPFYIMDEVEAALDDLNITRFLGLLDTYSDQAQFIVVTHQKRTMEAADALYGVSMGGDGISKVVSRRLPTRVGAAAPAVA